MSTPQTWTLTSFREALGQAMYRIHQARNVHRDLGSTLAAYGIPEPAVSDAGVTFTIPEPDDDDTPGWGGVKRSDLTDEARARHDAERLTQLRRSVYEDLSYAVRHGDYPKDAVLAELEGLGFPMPAQRTHVEVTFNVGGKSYSRVFGLPGKHTEDDVRSALAAEVEDDPGTALVKRVFPGAENLGEPVSSVYTSTQEKWAKSSTIQ